MDELSPRSKFMRDGSLERVFLPPRPPAIFYSPIVPRVCKLFLPNTIKKENSHENPEWIQRVCDARHVLDLAVGFIIGGAFGKVVSSMVADVLMPPLGVLMGGVDFSFLGFTIREATQTHPAAVLRYGIFINQIIDFTIVAFAVFLLIKMVNRLKRDDKTAKSPATPTSKICPKCCMAIPLAATRCGYCTSVLK